MLTFESGIDIRCREVAIPTIARFYVSSNEYRFIVIGTQYGYLHKTNGDIYTWRSYSGAYRAAKNYIPI